MAVRRVKPFAPIEARHDEHWSGGTVTVSAREAQVRRGINLRYVTILYNSLEAIGSLIAGALAGSVALIGFGIDSVLEVSSSIAAQCSLRSYAEARTRVVVELL